jgi:hypothetical protein
MTNKKISFREATKDMSPDDIRIYRQELSEQSFNDAMSNKDSRGGLIQDLHTILFSEANDFAYDSGIDYKQRKRGINPMRQEYTDKMNQKRIDLGVSPLGKDGTENNADTMQLCKDIAAKLTEHDIKNLISELTHKSAHEMVAIIKKLEPLKD